MIKKIVLEKCFEAQLKELVSIDGGERVISENCVIYNGNNEFVGLIIKGFLPAAEANFIMNSLSEIKFPKSHRASGLISNSEIFGFSPREHLKGYPCRSCKFNFKYPHQYFILDKISRRLKETYQIHIPDIYQKHSENIKKIGKNWVMQNQFFTSGIINLDTQYRYHTDNGNIKDTFASMLYFGHKIIGGDVKFPEYNAILKFDLGDLIVFDNTRVSHGVTQFKKISKSSKRMSVVLYCLEQLKSCEQTFELENQRFNGSQI